MRASKIISERARPEGLDVALIAVSFSAIVLILNSLVYVDIVKSTAILKYFMYFQVFVHD